MEPLITVISPVYNGGKYIQQFIDSIRNQTYTNWELLLVDDGSTDNSPSIIANNAKADCRIHLYKRDESQVKGADTCRNIGQKNTRGKYFIVLDCDDEVDECCLSQRIMFMEDHPDLDFSVFPGYSVFQNPDGSMIRGEKKWGVQSKEDPLISLLKADYNFGVWNLIFKTETMKDQQWDENLRIYMDFDFMYNILTGNCKYAFCTNAKPDYGYIQGRSNAITSSFVSEDKYKSTKYLFDKTMKSIEKLESNRYKQAYYYFYLSFYKKVLHSKSNIMYEDYYQFFLNAYYDKLNLRLKFINIIVRNRMKKEENIGKLVDYIFTIIFYPRNVVRKVKGLIR